MNLSIIAAIVEMAALIVGTWLLLRPQTRFRHTLIVALRGHNTNYIFFQVMSRNQIICRLLLVLVFFNWEL